MGSISKTITALALAKLLDQDKINLDSPVTAYLLYRLQKKYAIAVWQIGSYVAGVRHYGGYEFNSAKHYNTV